MKPRKCLSFISFKSPAAACPAMVALLMSFLSHQHLAADQFTRVTTGAIVTDAETSESGAWADYDNDGYVDLYVANTTASGTTYNTLYHNEGGTNFTRVAVSPFTTDRMQSWYSAWADYDNDGDVDLVVANLAGGPLAQRLYRNNGNGSFSAVVDLGLLSDTAAATSPWWFDYDGDGFVDLFVTKGMPNSSANDCLFRNNGDGSFTRMTAAEAGPILDDQRGSEFCYSVDSDNDGRQELAVYYNTPSGYLLSTWRAGTDGTFVELPDGLPFGTVSWGDLDNNGWLDSIDTLNPPPALVRNLGAGGFSFADLAMIVPVAPASPAWADYDNDGWLDLFFTGQYWTGSTNGLFHNNGDGTFSQVLTEPMVSDGGRRWAPSWADFDNDGFLDLFIAVGDGQPEPNLLYRNNGNTNHWLKVKLNGTVSNRSGIGAKVRVLATIGGQVLWQVREISCGVGQGGSGGLLAHFGLGNAATVETLRIEWPSGNASELISVAADQVLQVTEPGFILPARPSASLGGSIQLTSRTGKDVQWYHDGVLLEGETNRTLNVTHVQAADAGRYSIVIATTAGFTTNYSYVYVDHQFTKVAGEPWETDLGNSPVAVVGDYDGDDYLDVFVGRYRSGRSALYHNNGDGTFLSVTNAVFPLAVGEYALGPCSDFDNDGRADVFVPRSDGNALSSMFYGNGDGEFVSAALATLSPWWQHSIDYDHDGWLDLYVTSWGAGQTNRLYRNLGDRSFQGMSLGDVGVILGLRTIGNAAWADYDDNGWEDVAMPDLSSGRCLLYRNLGAGRFEAVTNQITEASLPSALVASWGDYDNDDLLDLFVAGSMNVLFRNLGDGNFERSFFQTPVQAFYNGATWGDYDNDGFLDLFMTYGNGQGNDLFRNNGDGTFTTIVLGSIVNDNVAPDASYAGLWFDFDNNGFLDLLVPNGNDAGTAVVPNFLYRNNGNSNAWLKVKLVGTTSNREGAGAKVRVLASIAGSSRWQRRDITSGGDPYSGSGPIAHFGLGDAANVTTLQIEWPSGTVQEFKTVATNQFLTIVEPRRPVMTAAITAEGLFEVEFTTESDRTYGLQGSDDLVSWTVLETFTGTGAPMRWAETPAALHRFYRVVYR